MGRTSFFWKMILSPGYSRAVSSKRNMACQPNTPPHTPEVLGQRVEKGLKKKNKVTFLFKKIFLIYRV